MSAPTANIPANPAELEAYVQLKIKEQIESMFNSANFNPAAMNQSLQQMKSEIVNMNNHAPPVLKEPKV